MISVTLVLSVPGISSYCGISNSNAYMLSPTIANISATTTVATIAVAVTAAATATVTTAATIDTITAATSSTNTTTVAIATINSGTGTTVHQVYPKFGLFQFNYCMHRVSLVRM